MSKRKSHLVLLKNNTPLKKLPVILVPGLGFDHAMLRWKKILKEKGHPVEIAKLYKFLVALKTIEEQAKILANAVEKTLTKYKTEKCNLIGFSMGSVVCLYYLQRMLGNKKVHKCICATGPFWGTRRYIFLTAPLSLLARGLPEIFPGSPLLQDLISMGEMEGVNLYTLRGEFDMLCSERSGQLPYAENKYPLPTGHVGIYFALNKEAVQWVLKLLKD